MTLAITKHRAIQQGAIRLAFHQQAADELGGDRLGRAGEEALGEVLGGLGGYWSGFKEWHISRLSLVSEITFREERGGK
jgi:hypothetical protein